MGLGEILTGWNDSINNFIADHNSSYDKWLQQDRAAAQQRAATGAPAPVENKSMLQQWTPDSVQRSLDAMGSHQLGGLFAAAGDVPGFNKTMSYLDYGRRAADTLLITAKHAGAASKGDDMESFGELLNGSNWSKAWDMAAYDNPNRVTGGQILASQAFGPDDQIEVADPLDAKGAEAIQNGAQGTWYGQAMAGTMDLATSFITPPGLGVATKAAKAGRAAKSVGTVADAEGLAQHIATTGGEAAKVNKAGDFANELLNRPRDYDSVLGRMNAGMRDIDGITDESKMMNVLAPRLENTPDGTVVAMARDMVHINKTIEDPVLRESIRTNYVLAGMGSNTARQMLALDAPLLAKSFERISSGKAPEVQALTELFSTRLGAGNADLTVNEVMDRVYNTAGDRAELDALRDHVVKATQDAKDARALAAQIRAEKPAKGADRSQWMQDKFAADQLVRDTIGERDLAAGFAKSKVKEVAGKQAEIKDLTAKGSTLNLANDMLNNILLNGEDSARMISGRFEATALDRLKEHVRGRIGAEHYVTVGDGNTIVKVRSLPGNAARRALAPQARGRVALTETDLGRRQLGDVLARSGVYSKEEVAAAQNKFAAAAPHARQEVVAQLSQDSLERVAVQWFAKNRGLDLTPEEAVRRAKEITGAVIRHHGQGNDWVSRAANEQIDKGMVLVRDADAPAVAFDEPMLRSHLADSVGVLDPGDFKRMLDSHESSIVQSIKNGGHTLENAHDMLLQAWKVGALLRPGLMVRAFLDTGPRALASMSAAHAFMQSMNGAANVLHNARLRTEIRLGKKPEDALTRLRSIGTKPVTVKVNGRTETHLLAQDAADLQSSMAAMSKGQTVHGALFGDMSKAYNGLKIDRSNWVRRQAGHEHWAIAYKEYAGMLLASPTARKMADLLTKKADDVVDPAALRREIKSSPEFLNEWRTIAQPMGRDKEQFLDHVMHEVSLMFPSERLLNAAKSGHLTKKMVDDELPANLRFDIPSPDISVVEQGKRLEAFKGMVDKGFRLFLDKPDMWMARLPAARSQYRQALGREYDAFAKRFGNDAVLTPEMKAAIDRKAKSEAIQYVRRTFFDTTRYTGAHSSVVRISPFFAAWEDAMMSWGRLILDDPRRLVKLNAAYHAPQTISTSTGYDLLVNESGEKYTPGSDDQAFIAVPGWALKPLAAANIIPGVDTKNVRNYRIRLGSLNSIFQGETWWLPGTGPTAQIPITWTLGSGKLMDRETALELVGTDSWLGKQVLKSMYLDGELPPSDLKTQASTLLPGWVRNLASETLGTGKIRNQKTTFNYLVTEAAANGEPLTEARYRELWDQAGRTANGAAVVRLVASAGFGMTGSAAVDGQFYADQMHIIDAMTEEQRGGLTAEEYFSQQFPEAAELDWRLTKNETGITASVQASKAESRLDGVLKSNKEDLGWMILGRDNLVDPEFSRTAYNFQKTDGNRRYLSSRETQSNAQAAVGWRQYNAWTQQALDMVKQSTGMDDKTALDSDQYRAMKKAITDYLMQNNAAFAEDKTTSSRKFDYFYSQAVRLSSSGQLKDRSDMVAFKEYDHFRMGMMRHFGVQSLSGTGSQYVEARRLIRERGNELAQDNLGFKQMWDRFLSTELDRGDELTNGSDL